jgi:hypothetical protein
MHLFSSNSKLAIYLGYWFLRMCPCFLLFNTIDTRHYGLCSNERWIWSKGRRFVCIVQIFCTDRINHRICWNVQIIRNKRILCIVMIYTKRLGKNKFRVLTKTNQTLCWSDEGKCIFIYRLLFQVCSSF